MDLSKKVGNLSTNESVDASIEALITFMCDVLRDVEEYRKILEDEYKDCNLELKKKKSSISYEDYKRIEKLYDKFEKQLSRFSEAFTQDYLDILTVGLELSNLRVKHGAAMREYDKFELEDKKFAKKATNLARKIERIIKKHDKLAVVYNTQIDKLDTFHKHLEKQLIIYTTNYDRKFVIPVKDYIAEFRSVKSDDTYKKKAQIISDHLKGMLKRMNKSGYRSPFVRISKLEDVNFDSDDKGERKRKGDGSGIDGAKRRNAAASDKPLLDETQIGLPNLQRVSSNAFQFESSQDARSQDDILSSEQSSSNASEEIVEHSDVSESGPGSSASGFEETGETGMINSQQNMEILKINGEEMDNDEASEIDRSVEHLRNKELTTDLDPDDRSSPERSRISKYKSKTLKTSEGIREERRQESKGKSRNSIMLLRGVNDEFGEESDNDADNDNQNKSSELGNKFGASESKEVRFDLEKKDLNNKKRLQSKIDQMRKNLRKKSKINPENPQISKPQVYDMVDKDLIASGQTIFGKLLELERQKKIKKELLSYRDGNEDSGENAAPTTRLESDVTASDSEGLQSEDKGSSDSDGSSDSANNLVRLAQKRRQEENDDPYYDVLEHYVPISKRRMVPRRRIKSDVTASDSKGLQSEDKRSSDSDGSSDSANNLVRLAQKRRQEENDDPYYDVLEHYVPISKRRMIPRRRIKSDVTASDSKGLQSEDKRSSDSDGSSDSANNLVRLAQKRRQEENDDPYYDVLEHYVPISKRRMVPRRRIKSDVTASDSESSDDSDSDSD
ncbi:uncharacterized protein LOC141525615 [Cotesia typhae]|uniref:uncharacterized protein LOC141525615 n=1 Tax=Cotesia typhae TaxID=2053667 RepID=UPI003D682FD9